MANLITLDLMKDTFKLDLEKAGVVTIPTMATKLAVDASGSMDEEFSAGYVDRAINLFLGAALNFDDDGELEVGFFNHRMTRARNATAADFGTYVRSVGAYASGGTEFTPIIDEFEQNGQGTKVVQKQQVVQTEKPAKGFFGRLMGKTETVTETVTVDEVVRDRSTDTRHAAYVGVITDGDASDHSYFESMLAQTSGDTFYQFIAIGTQINVDRLQRTLSRVKHANLIHIKDPYKVDDEAFYQLLVNDTLVDWINR